ncbi:unnamed protein product [Rotaria sordida]|uniref:Uncharacterized protein n=1 Tax=Rotaria sordida TaxID=392033 RepID=A0A814N557_9BILA|nr:unnamed protein product [Rotaria sordida]
MNLSSALLQNQNENQLLNQQQDGRLGFFHEYLRNNYPVKQQLESPYDPAVFFNNQEKSNIHPELIAHLNWLKRDLRLNNPVNKRMLCFFHAVNCFG